MYLYYQCEGGDEPWQVIQADYIDDVIRKDKPTFITVLQVNMVVPDKPTREQLDGLKYVGPFYMDLDDAEDVGNSITDAKSVVERMLEAGLLETDIQVYLTGKKGLHIVVPPQAFMQKIVPVKNLPAIYKDMAFKFAASTTDFRVYTARRGRMFRTCYRQRDNGNWRVPVTVDELMELTVEKYYEFCGQEPREFEQEVVGYRPRFGLIYDEVSQKLGSIKKKKPIPVNPSVLKSHEPLIQEVLSGVGLADVGFNRIAIQVCLYAREAHWSEDYLIQQARGLINHHQSDGNRYNTPSKRERHLRDMFFYVEDNASYEYSLDPIKALLVKHQRNERGEDASEEPITESTLSSGVLRIGNAYFAERGEGGPVQITNFIFNEPELLLDAETGAISSITVAMQGDSTVRSQSRMAMSPANFTGSSSLHNTVASYGGSFTGSDTHARGLFQVMLKEVTLKKYLVDTEGVNILQIAGHPVEELRKPFLAWADRDGVRLPSHVRELGVEFEFQGYPDERGVFRTDITKAPSLNQYLATPTNKKVMERMFLGMFRSQQAEVVGKLLGWMTACFWRPLFNHGFSKFPLLHVYGPAGAGKTEFTTSFMNLFFKDEEPKVTSPSSTPFAFLTFVGGSNSIPIILDEYKPSKMKAEQLESFRGIFRDAYNMKSTQRGGGNRNKDAYNALNTTQLAAPIAFIAESMETETAIVERMVLVSFRRPAPQVAAANYGHFIEFKDNGEALSVLGHTLAASVTRTNIDTFKEEFQKLLSWAQDAHMLRVGDNELVRSGEMSQAEYNRRLSNKQRNIYNNTVALFGLRKMRAMVAHVFKEEFDALFSEYFDAMEHGIFGTMDVLARSTLPEYLKVLSAMSDQTRTADDQYKAVQGFDYMLIDHGGRQMLLLAYRQMYNRYRAYSRWSNSETLYANDTAFYEGLLSSPQYEGTANQIGKYRGVRVVVLDYSELIKAGMSEWAGDFKAEPMPSLITPT
jgi:hypothetical protein